MNPTESKAMVKSVQGLSSFEFTTDLETTRGVSKMSETGFSSYTELMFSHAQLIHSRE